MGEPVTVRHGIIYSRRCDYCRQEADVLSLECIAGKHRCFTCRKYYEQAIDDDLATSRRFDYQGG